MLSSLRSGIPIPTAPLSDTNFFSLLDDIYACPLDHPQKISHMRIYNLYSLLWEFNHRYQVNRNACQTSFKQSQPSTVRQKPTSPAWDPVNHRINNNLDILSPQLVMMKGHS
jgi:hypothetical protein